MTAAGNDTSVNSSVKRGLVKRRLKLTKLDATGPKNEVLDFQTFEFPLVFWHRWLDDKKDT